MLALHAKLMKDGMAKTALVLLDISRLMEPVSHATLILTILAKTVFATLDFTEMERANATNATVHAENA